MTSQGSPSSPRAPQPLSWQVGVAIEAMKFFSIQGRDEALAILGRTDPAGKFVPFEGSDFLQYLGRLGYSDIWPKVRHVAAVLDGLVREGHLTRFPGTTMTPGVPGSFVTVAGPTPLQRQGDLWLAPVFGPMLLIPRVGGATIPITGVSHEKGDVAIGSGIALDGEHILTAAHVVSDMQVDDEFVRPAVDSALDSIPHPAGTIHVEEIVPHPDVDVAIIRVSGADGRMDAADGLTWRDPAWSDELTILGYPSVPTTFGTYLIVQRGEVVNPHIVTNHGEAFLFSAIARPGNSGGPVIGRDGRLLGVATHEPFAADATHPAAENTEADQYSAAYAKQNPDEDTGDKPAPQPKRPKAAPFYAGVPSSVIAEALNDIGFGKLARLETWD